MLTPIPGGASDREPSTKRTSPGIQGPGPQDLHAISELETEIEGDLKMPLSALGLHLESLPEIILH